MTIDKIKMFLAVCLYGTVSKAAESLFISQPAVSQGIRELEKELATELFQRDGRRLTLSPQGKELLPLATKLVETYEETVSLFEPAATTSLTIGCTLTTATYMLPELITAYEQQHQVTIQIIVDNVVAITHLLAENKIDVGFIEGLSTNDDFLYYPLNLFELVFVAGSEYLHNRPKAFAAHDFLVREQGSSYRILFDNYYSLQQGTAITPKWISFSNDVLKQAAIHNQGVALLPYVSVSDELTDGRLQSVSFAQEPPTEYNGLIVNKYRAAESKIVQWVHFVQATI